MIGRQPDNHLILRDSRVSRSHARIVVEDGAYVLEDCGSRHGTFVNGKRVTRKVLDNTDRVEFGAQDSYQLLFALDGVELKRLMEQMGGTETPRRRASAPTSRNCAPFWTWRARCRARSRSTKCWPAWSTRR